ncbi:type II toxin-antitoxin system PemK/MazF family toxin [Thermoanaerobacterium sp. RBIITD]|uniref:type II toxin-antitoxin system PemK/MazF family toxin n=1 Tax=Thermoanaerobacterium sp. RBIITD TaxID=1550240 RepID=UPI000BB99367|nr:type II toxin-antitoxin system PemK/MazF family toxin [Thermoanaerobacterium sp. RBIITD]SNX53687.1 mRNA interferase MazF [Thermoanaerobacterium sp. RBIITD]
MFKQGDILLIPIPFSNLTSNKKRPVLVLSNDDYNIKTEDIVVAAITSNVAVKDYIFMLTSDDLDEGVLKVDSCIRVDKIYTLSQSIVISRFGAVKKHIINAVKEKLYELI